MRKGIDFKEIAVEGFGSFVKPVGFNLNRGGINLIKGSNGAGKTTLFSALLWAVYKTNLKNTVNAKVASWKHVRGSGWRGTRVSITFDVLAHGYSFMIVRHLDFKGETFGIKGESSLFILRKPISDEKWSPSHIVGESLHKGDQQGFINRAIGLDAKTFLNSVLFGQRMKRIIEAENDDKRKLFETIFDLDFVGKAKTNADNKLVELSNELVSIEAERNSLDTILNTKQLDLDRRNDLMRDFKDRKAKEIDGINADIESLKKELLENKETLKKCEDFKKENSSVSDYEKLLSEQKECSDSVKNLQKECDEKEAALLSEFLDSYDGKIKELEGLIDSERKSIESYEEEISAGKKRISELESEERELVASMRNKDSESLSAQKKEKDTQLSDLKSDNDLLYRDKQALTVSLEDYRRSLETAKVELAQLSKDYDNVDTVCKYCEQPISEDKVSKVKDQIKQDKKKKQEYIDTLEKKIPDIEKTLETKKEDLNTSSDKINKLSKEIDELSIQINSIMTRNYSDSEDVLNLKKKIEFCSATVEKDESQMKVSAEKLDSLRKDLKTAEQEKAESKSNKLYLQPMASMLQDLDDKNKELAAINDAVASMEEVVKTLETIDKKMPILISKIEGIESSMRKEEERLETCRKEDAPKLDIENLEIEIKNDSDKIKEISEKIEELKVKQSNYQWWSKTGFGAGGVKAFVFNTGLLLLNSAVDKYASRLGVRLEFSIDLTKASKPFITKCFKDGADIDYADLSGGQKARLDVATAFALHDVVTSMADVNILILDEVTENLDAEGIEAVFDLIRVKAGEDRTVYVITHQSQIDCLNAKTIEFSLGSDKSTVIE
jgi:exonuclease SbcC